jgi:Ca2+-binding RTX toxin-like protein
MATITGTPANNVLNGTANGDTIIGLAGNDTIRGKGGADRIDGGPGDDIINGNAGADVFVLRDGEGRDVINDFEDGTDRIALEGGLTFADLERVAVSGATLLNLNDDTLAKIKGVTPAQLTQADFIEDGTPPPTTEFSIQPLDAAKNEGDAGITAFTFAVTRSGGTGADGTVDWAVLDAGPTDADDFDGTTLPADTVTFATGETSKTVTVPVTGDTAVEGDEVFTVQLSNASGGATIATATAVGSIVNDDSDPGDPGATTFLFEAEDATLTGPMAERSDPGASNGAYVATSARDQGTASFAIDDAEAGTYVLSARVLAETGGRNSFFVSVNGGPEQYWDITPLAGQWQVATMTVTLGDGANTLTFRGREANTGLDSLSLNLGSAVPPPGENGGGPSGPITGTDGDDTLTGTAGPDVIKALAGDDEVSGLAGNDTIDGGSGDDTLDGGDDDDTIAGDRLATLTDLGRETENNDTFATRNAVFAGPIDGIAYQWSGELASGGGDVDFVDFQLGAAAAGTPFMVEMLIDDRHTPISLGLFDAAGELLEFDVAERHSELARVYGIVPGDGRVTVAVSSGTDHDFDGNVDWSGAPHGDQGPYEFVLGTAYTDGNDSILGGNGNDVITDGAGRTSSIIAGPGDDDVTVNMAIEEEVAGTLALDIVIQGDDGADTIVSTPLAINTQYGYEDESPDGFTNIVHRVEGGAGNDDIQIIPTAEANNDAFNAGSTHTTVFGDDGDDTIDVRPLGNRHNAGTIDGGPGNDDIRFENGAYITSAFDIAGGDGDDTVTLIGNKSYGGAFTVTGGVGNDTSTVDFESYDFYNAELRLFVFGDDGVDTIDIAASESSGFAAVVANEAHGGADGDTITARAVASARYGSTADARNELFGDDGDDSLTAIASATSSVSSHATAVNTLDGGAGNDTLVGEIAADSSSGLSHLLGGTGADQLTVIRGENNILDGGAGDDTLTGGDNADIFVLRAGDGTDTVTNFQKGSDVFVLDGIDYADLAISAAGGSSTVRLGGEDLAIVQGVVGLAPSDFGVTGPGIITGTAGDDSLDGTPGDDVIDGRGGNDTLTGGLGIDTLIGGPGGAGDRDVYRFETITDSGLLVGERDVINGFDNPGAAAGDLIDLSGVAGGASLTFMGGAAFTGVNQVRVYTQSSNQATIVAINTAGGTAPEARIEILDGGVDDSAYTADDFILASASKSLAVFVEPSLLPGISTALDVYRADLQDEGYAVTIEPFAGDADDLRAELHTRWEQGGLDGAFFIGDVPYKNFNYGETFPHDLYFMDLDGTYEFFDDPGVNDRHVDGAGDIEPEIYVSRLTTGNMASETWVPGLARPEVDLVNDYLDRVHLYRTGDPAYQYENSVLSIGADNLVPAPDTYSPAFLYDELDSVLVNDGRETKEDYFDLLDQDHEWLHVNMHGGAFNIQETDIVQADAKPGYYFLWQCGSGDFSDEADNHELEAYVLGGSRGLAGVGSTKSGGMQDAENFYQALGEGQSMGEAMQHYWNQRVVGTDESDPRNLIGWNYGLVVQGDPTLRPASMGDGPPLPLAQTADDLTLAPEPLIDPLDGDALLV